ncbi:MAG TPA: hypothetical protein VF727_07915 [Allosphingosinicella sp.]
MLTIARILAAHGLHNWLSEAKSASDTADCVFWAGRLAASGFDYAAISDGAADLWPRRSRR